MTKTVYVSLLAAFAAALALCLLAGAAFPGDRP